MLQDHAAYLFSVPSCPDGRRSWRHVPGVAAEGNQKLLMGFLGIGNNPMVGCTVACAVDVATALNK